MTTALVNTRYLNGFRLVSPAYCNIVSLPAAAVNIAKGECMFDNGAGFVTNVGVAFAATFEGIALEPVDNSAGAAGDLNVLVVLPTSETSFWVGNDSATVAAQTDVGEMVDLETNHSIDVTDETLVSWGFRIEFVDISTAALSAKAGGWARGRILPQPQ